MKDKSLFLTAAKSNQIILIKNLAGESLVGKYLSSLDDLPKHLLDSFFLTSHFSLTNKQIYIKKNFL